jgi:sugar transferase (PEP-CTERM/EpsH1 system associated)
VRILFLTPRFPYPPFRGDKLRAFNFIKRLSRDHEVALASFIEPEETELAKDMESYCHSVTTVPLNKTRSYLNCMSDVFKKTPFQVSYFRSPAMEKAVDGLIEEFKPDLIHAHLFRMAPYALRHKNIPKVIDLCDSIALNYERFLKYRRDALRPLYMIEKKRVEDYEALVTKEFDASLVISPLDKEYIKQNPKAGKIKIVPNGVDVDYFTPDGEDKQDSRLVFMGTIGYFPNYDGVLFFLRKIFPSILQQEPEAQFYIVGNKPPRDIEKMNDGKKIFVTGYVDDVRPYVRSSEVFVCPIRAATGLNNKILEAMAMGVPVVATPQACEGIEMDKEEDIAIAEGPDDFAGQVVKLLNDGKLRSKLSSNGRRLVEQKYTWDINVDKLEQIYDKAMHKK